MLFGLVGASVSLNEVVDNAIVLAYGLIILVCGLVLRLPSAYFSCCGTELTRKEKAFVAISWIPKATVQAALSSEILDAARETQFKYINYDPNIPESYYCQTNFLKWGIQILTLTILFIVLTAPAGAIMMASMGPKLCRRSDIKCEDDEVELDEDETMLYALYLIKHANKLIKHQHSGLGKHLNKLNKSKTNANKNVN